jgi:dTDP-4-dehydrorhamnose reductase
VPQANSERISFGMRPTLVTTWLWLIEADSTSPTRWPSACSSKRIVPMRSSTLLRTPLSTRARRIVVNAVAVGSLRDAADATETHLVHVSTDYVFDGTLDRPYAEDDAPNPQSVYGVTKLEGERLAGDDASVVRTSWVCGEYGNNMVKLILRLAGGDAPLAFVGDQRGCPTFTADLAPALHRLASDRHSGTFHLTNGGAVSWYEFVGDILEAAGHDRSRVTPISTADLDPPRPAPRPANSVLDNAAWRAAGHRPLRHYREPLAELLDRLT